ncbi:MAG: hypothetical protein Q4C71_06010, partial [Microbacteriaceae bacterium]|nr:hypothetical protein [Microbacteriaceae bacterium]
GDSEAAAASVQQSVQQAKQQQAANKQAEQQKLKAGTTGAPGETKQGANDAKKSQQGGTAGDNAEDGAKGGILLSDPLVITGLVVGGAFLLILGIVIGLIIGRVKWAAKP